MHPMIALDIPPTIPAYGAVLGLLLFAVGAALGFTRLAADVWEWWRNRRYVRAAIELDEWARARDALAAATREQRRRDDDALGERLDQAAADEWAEAWSAWRFGA